MIRAFFRSRAHSFRHAFAGMWYVLRTQKNAWIHLGFTLFVILLAAWLALPLRDWAILILIIGIVWLTEFVNTSIEAMVDLASPQRHPLAKISKDVGAGAVLVAAGTSVIIGVLLLGPPLWAKIQTLFYPVR